MRSVDRLLFGVAMIALPGVALAQQVPPAATPSAPTAQTDDEDAPEPEDIIVRGSRTQPGAVIGDIPPEQQLGPADIRAYGVSSIGDLLTELAPELGSVRGSGGAPVVLLGGRRISGFSEIRDIPTEAIERVDILPEEVALKYGYRADQKVVNIVLRRRFHSITAEVEDTQATAGSRNSPEASLDVLRITRSGRVNLHLNYKTSDALFESDRDIVPQPSDFSLAGNVVGPVPNGEIDPALSAAAGFPVTIAGVNGTSPSFATFVGAANAPTTYDPGQYRSLLPSSHDFTANAVLNRTIFGNVSATLNGQLEATGSESRQGLPTAALTLPASNAYSPFGSDVVVDRALDGFAPLSQRRSEVDAHLGTTLNGDFSPKWRWTLTANYDRADSEAFTETGVDYSALQAAITANDPAVNPFGPIDRSLIGAGAANQAYSTSSAGEINALFTGPLFALPAGSVSTSIKAGGSTNDFDSRSIRGGVLTPGKVSRDIENGQINVDVPLTSRSKNFLGAIGNLSVNGNYAVDHLSDFGTLTTTGYGANWAPIEQVRFIASVTDRDDAPSAQLLGNPVIVTPNVRVFDFVNGQTVNVTQISGGNPNLLRSNQRLTKFGATIKPFDKTDLTLTASYVTRTTRNASQSLPSATAAIEAAFPDRFVRDDDGNLIRFDNRPVNFASQHSSELRWGGSLTLKLKSKLQKEFEAFRAGKGPNPLAGLFPEGGRRRGGGDGGGDRAPGGDRQVGEGGGGRGGGGFGGRGGGGRGGQAGGRLQFALYHTWHFTDTVQIRDGLPVLDRLNGDATGNGQPRHEVEGRIGYTNNGIGVRLDGNWQSGTQVRGGTVGAPDTLDFSGLTKVNLRLFADLTQQLKFIKDHKWARGMRITFGVNNVFDAHQRVTDATGATPISYQPDYLDPLGRTVKLSIRKLFF